MPTPTATIFIPYHALDNLNLRGTRASQPLATAVVPGTLYSVTDELNKLERSNGSVWEAYESVGGGVVGPDGAVADNIAVYDGTTGQIIKDGGTSVTQINTEIETVKGDVLFLSSDVDNMANAQIYTANSALATYPNSIALVPGTNIEFEYDDIVHTTRINATGGGTGADEVFIGTDDPGATYELWYDTDESQSSTVIAHHITHETGGTDAITNLDGGVITSGTVADTRLSTNVALKNAANTFTQTQKYEMSIPQIILNDTSQPVDARKFRALVISQQYVVDCLNDAETIAQSSPLILNRAGDAKIGRDVYEKGRTTPMGHWQSVPFNAANFSAVGGTWSIAAGHIATFAYTLIGVTMIVTMSVQGTSISSGVTELRVVLPASRIAQVAGTSALMINNNGWGAVSAVALVQPASFYIHINRTNLSAFNAGELSFYLTLPLAINP